jgi:hypothetical protein
MKPIVLLAAAVTTAAGPAQAASRSQRRQTLNFNIPGGPGGYAANLRIVQEAVNGSEKLRSHRPSSTHSVQSRGYTGSDAAESDARAAGGRCGHAGAAVFLGWDSQIFWGSRSDLWNHFNSSAPGYDANNAENVEWTSWSSRDAVDVSWLNWGRQMRVVRALGC